MPLPRAREDEKEDDFMERCMTDPMMKEEHEVLPERAAACITQWKRGVPMSAVFKAVELARVGKFEASTGPVTLTAEDFDNIVEAYLELKGKVDIPVKLGHDEQSILEESGLPAAGWVENVRRIGDKLVADLVQVPDEVAKLIRSGALRKRSIEAIRNVKLAGKRFKFALTGLALLGTELPAVDSLEDIAALYASGRVFAAGELHDSEAQVVIVVMATDVKSMSEVELLIEELRKTIDKIAATTAGKRGAPKLRQLLSVAVDELRRTGAPVRAGANTQEEEMDIAVLRTMLALPDTASEQEVLAALAEKLGPPKTDAPPSTQTEATLAKLGKDLTEAQTKIIQLENERARQLVTTKVDDAIKARRFMPASRDSLIKLAMHDTASFDELVKGTPENSVLGSEKGTTSGDGLPSELEPTAIELKVAASLGLTKEDVIKSKAREAGVDYTPATKKE